MFTFEDPVGVELSEADGALSGRGCAGGLPSPNNNLTVFGCGVASGKVTGHQAFLSFSFESYTYAADTTISADGSRMTGRFHDTSEWEAYPMAWRRSTTARCNMSSFCR